MADPEGLPHPNFVRLSRRPALFAAFLATAAAIIIITTLASGAGHPTASNSPRVAPATPQRDPAAATSTRLTLSQLAGQHIIYAYSGITPPASLITRVRRAEAAGVILFSNNIGTLAQTHAAIRLLQRAAMESVVHEPILVMTDQEGGQVRRLPGAPLFSEKQIGEQENPEVFAGAAGTEAARELHKWGFNVNLAPVLDVARSPHGFVGHYERSYGNEPHQIAKLGAAFISAQQTAGVAATAKHFPGLGTATINQDTDAEPATLATPLTTLRAVDEVPYVPAIAAGVRLVMTSWAVYLALDPARPAGLSPTVIQRELRSRLGFRGVTITDGLGAGALTEYGSYANRGRLAAEAGADLILCTARSLTENTPTEGITVLHAIRRRLVSAPARTTSETSAERILGLRQAAAGN